jgi:hypothetical protein
MMRVNPVRAEGLELDAPFDSARPPSLHLERAVGTPTGDELVDEAWCEEPTRVMQREELDRLLEQERLRLRLTQQQLHTRPTVRSMQAVYPPSSRPEPVVEVVDSSGRRVDP